MKNTDDVIITNCALIKQKKAKITQACVFFCFLLFAIRRRLRSHFKNSCFVFYRGFQTLENNKSPRPISFLVFGNPGKTLALVFEILHLNPSQVSCIHVPHTKDETRKSGKCHPGYKGKQCELRE